MSMSRNNSWLSNNSGLNNSNGAFSDANMIDANSFQIPTRQKNTEFIMDRSAMEQYLKDVSQHEKEIEAAIEAQNNIQLGHSGMNQNSFWGRSDEIVLSLKSPYQLSPHNSKQSLNDETYKNDQENNSEAIRNVGANKLSNYTANLKMVSWFIIIISFLI